MQQLSSEDYSSELSGSTVLLAEVLALIGKKDIQAREQAFNLLYADYQERIIRYFVVEWRCDKEHAADLCGDTFMRVGIWLRLWEIHKPGDAKHQRNSLYGIA